VICEKFATEGCNVAINYANRQEAADELAKKLSKYGTKTIVLKGVSPLHQCESITNKN
jgi:NAD(P)-dependent dehydrogenase (short-subunit alcohol dehydrogenase family)